MKKFALMLSVLVSSVAFGADWSYVTSSSTGSDLYIDKSFYFFDEKNKTVDIWYKSEKTTGLDKTTYVESKTLSRFSCPTKKQKHLAQVTYDKFGGVLRSSDKPDSNYQLIFPDTVAEDIWLAACISKGKGLRLLNLEIATTKDLERLLPK